MLQALYTNINPDMTAKVYGPLLFNKGIKIRITNVEIVNERCIRHWKKVCSNNGYNATIEHDISAGYVIINCRTRPKIPLVNIAIVALSVILLARYLYFY